MVQKTKSTILSGPRVKLVIAFNPQNSQDQMFIQNIDKVLGALSGADRIDITAISDRSMLQQFDMTTPSIALYKNNKLLGSTSVKTSSGLTNFFNRFKKVIWA